MYRKYKVSVLLLLSQMFIPKYWYWYQYRFYKVILVHHYQNV